MKITVYIPYINLMPEVRFLEPQLDQEAAQEVLEREVNTFFRPLGQELYTLHLKQSVGETTIEEEDALDESPLQWTDYGIEKLTLDLSIVSVKGTGG